ncbi:MAG: hypothetical protein KGD70_04445 [Candidatus Lokiarchaeota archaeon]|jgi:hypothetical protein|nr:hypothetical protein [Candidatus Lokiarchaeota archaeon]
MTTIFYKVIFRGIKGDSSESYSLTFKNIIQDKPINIPSQFFSSLKLLSQKQPSVINFQNIREIVKIGDQNVNYDFNYYIVVLYTSLADGKKEGFLVGNLKKLGDILIGIWPFNQENISISSEHFLKQLNLLTDGNKFKDICVIYS